MPNQLHIHQIQNRGDLLDLIRQGVGASLQSIELKTTVGSDHTGTFMLEMGHPQTARRKAAAGLTPMPIAEVLQTIADIGGVNQLVIDIKARHQDRQFAPGEREFMYEALPAAIAAFQAVNAENNIATTIAISTDDRKILEDARDGLVLFGDGVQMRHYVADTHDKDPFAEAQALHAEQMVFGFPLTGNKQPDTAELTRLYQLWQTPIYQSLKPIVFIRGNVAYADVVDRYFPGAEINSDVVKEIEKERQQAVLDRK